jgi:glycerophosphoryl diester phosphodiesterase
MKRALALALLPACTHLGGGGEIVPIVIGHRGACGYRPEHTLEAYRLAIVMGADFIEPDLVPTRDGALIARHESHLDRTTNIADLVARGELPDRRCTKVIDGKELTGYFSEDYTLAEIKKLRARERIPDHRPQCAVFDDRFGIPTLSEIIELVRDVETQTGLKIGIYPETKHPTYFALEGNRHDGTPIGHDSSELLVEVLVSEKFTDPRRVYIQSFEVANLLRLHNEIMPRHGVELPLVQLLKDVTSRKQPYDMAYHGRRRDDAATIYGDLSGLVTIEEASYGDLVAEPVLRFVSSYAAGLGPWKENLLLDEQARTAIRLMRSLGLEIHPYTFRTEEHFLSWKDKSVTDEILDLLDLGITGFFTDYPDQGRFARDLWMRRATPPNRRASR